jgi:ribosomal protein S18 acetylase RimI-like enzyme
LRHPEAHILTDLSPASLAVAIKANLYAFFGTFRAASQVSVHEDLSGFRWRTAIAHPWFNGVLSTQPPAADASQTVRATLAYFQAHGVASFTWWLAPQVEPAGWAAHLLPLGFTYEDSTPGMAIDLANLPPPGNTPLTIQRVADQATLSVWAQVFTQGYGIPNSMTPAFQALIESLGIQLPLRYYLGSLNGQPVAASTLFIGAGVAGVYNVATLAESRGQGFGSALTLTPLVEARALGYRLGVLQSSEMGYRLYQRLGFQKLCQMDHFYWSGQEQQGDS